MQNSMLLFFFLVFDQKYFFGEPLPKKLNGKFKLQFGTRDWGTWGDLPDYLKNLLVLSGPLIVLAQKRWFCNFHTVFGHIAPIPPPPPPSQVDPNGKPGYLDWFQWTEFDGGVICLWFRLEILSYANFIQKIKIASLLRNLVSRLIWICRIQ